MTAEQCDVLVVGTGLAGLCAALAAHQAGARVALVETAPSTQRGGNTRFAVGVVRCTYGGVDDLAALVADHDDPAEVTVDPYTREDFLRDLDRVTGGQADRALGQVMADRSYETMRWLADLGVPFALNRGIGTTRDPDSGRVKLPFGRALLIEGEGPVLSDALFRRLEADDVPVLYETEALRVLTSPTGVVAGLEARSPEGVRVLSCRALVLASGGFQSSPEMRVAYLGPAWGHVRVRGTRFTTGALHRAALGLGATAYGEWSSCHATLIDADSPDYGDLQPANTNNRLAFPYSIMVNLRGERFVDEGQDLPIAAYARMGAALVEQPRALAFQVFDAKTLPILDRRYETGHPIEARSLSELADGLQRRFGSLGFQREAFLSTLEGFNRAVQDGRFDPDVLDGCRTIGLRPDKTNWAVRLDTPPFRAYPVTVGISFTFGGIRANGAAEVVDQLDRAIPGLFAAGDITGGFFYSNYPGGGGLTRAAVFGRVAGQQAAAFARAG